MRWNSKNKLPILDKRERDVLDRASSILADIGRVGTATMTQAAVKATTSIAEIQSELNPADEEETTDDPLASDQSKVKLKPEMAGAK